MKRYFFIVLVLLICTIPFSSSAASLEGTILLQVEAHGEAWYVYPEDSRRYYMKNGDVAYEMLRTFGLGITNKDLALIPVGLEERFQDTDSDTDGLPDQLEEGLGTDPQNRDTDNDGVTDGDEIRTDTDPLGTEEIKFDPELVQKLSGRILLQVQSHGEAWYINPATNRRYYMKDGEAAYQIMRFLSLGITNKDLAKVPRGSLEPRDSRIDAFTSFTQKIIGTSSGTFNVNLLTVDLSASDLDIFTTTANLTDCETDCPSLSVGEYAMQFNALGAINGSYFCPESYSDCQSQTNYYYYPFYNSANGTLINADQLLYPTSGSLLAFDVDNNYYFFESTLNFKSQANFESKYNTVLAALVGSSPTLVYEGYNVVERHALDTKQENQKLTRAAIGVKDTTLYLLTVQSATVSDMAEIGVAMGLRYALNLDGGYSSALYYDGRYRLGPGRDVPNAILFGFK